MTHFCYNKPITKHNKTITNVITNHNKCYNKFRFCTKHNITITIVMIFYNNKRKVKKRKKIYKRKKLKERIFVIT